MVSRKRFCLLLVAPLKIGWKLNKSNVKTRQENGIFLFGAAANVKFSEVTAPLGENKIEKKWVARYGTAMVSLLMLLFDASVLLMLLLSYAVQESILNFIVPVIEKRKKMCTIIYICNIVVTDNTVNKGTSKRHKIMLWQHD